MPAKRSPLCKLNLRLLLLVMELVQDCTLCVYVCVFMYVCARACVHMCARLCVSIQPCTCRDVFTFFQMLAHELRRHKHACVFVCVYVCVLCVCVNVREGV
jgi:uncharacterized membrane protein YecN with MAPEG domain